MASSDDLNDDHLSIIPYDTNREIVLRNANSVVVFDPQSRQLTLRNRSRGLERPVADPNCPECGRPYNQTSSSAVEDDLAEEQQQQQQQQPSFINSEYFRLLANSLPGSNRSSAPPSPRRQLAQPVRPSPLAASSNSPPPDAEFVGSAPARPDSTHPISETAFAPKYFERFFVIEKELGRGGRGVVLLVKHVLDNVALGQFACKRVPVGDDHAWLEKVLVEVQALQSLSHQNLVSYRHVWLEDYQISNFQPSVPCAFILQQYCNGGDLHSYICASAQVQTTTQELKERLRRRSRGEADMPRKLNEPRKLHFDQIYSFFLDITEGLRFLHLNGFIHRDLKPSNCLLHQVGGETRVLVSDFGEVQYENAIRKSTGHTGTISYCAPEVLKPVSPGGPLGNFTFKSDVFSLGMILHFLCFADLPYQHANVLQEENEDLEELRDEIMSWAGFDQSWKKRPDLPGRLYVFLKQLLSTIPENRPTADDVLNGIKMGGLEFIPELKRRASSSNTSFANSTDEHDITSGKGRITAYDSPHPTSNSKSVHSAKGVSGPQERNAISPSHQVRRRGPGSPSLNQEIGSGTGSGADSPDMAADTRTTNISNISALMMRRSSSQGASNSVASPSTLDTTRSHAHMPEPYLPRSPQRELSPSPERQARIQLLLPPPSQPVTTLSISRAAKFLSRRIISPSFYVLWFAAKLMTLIQPCLSHGMNSTIFYVVFVLAAVELASMPHPVWRLALIATVHGAVLWYAGRKGVWCKAGGSMLGEWEGAY